MERDFKGVWIPKEIWLTKDLGWSEKLLLVEINSLDGEQGCFASNEYLGEFFGLSKDRISRMVSNLRDKGYVTVELQYKPGTKQIEKRIIRVVKQPIYPTGEKTDTYRSKHHEGIGENNDTPIGENTKDNNTSLFNNTINNTNNTAAPLFTSILKRINEQLLESLTMEQKQRLQTYVEQIEDPEVIYECINITEQETPAWPVQYLFKLLDKAIANKFTLDDVKRDHQQFKQQWEATFRTY